LEENRLYRQERLLLLGEMAAGVAHEVKNPFCAMRGLLELGVQDERLDLQDINIISRELLRVEKIVEQYLFLARPNYCESEKLEINNLLEEIQPLLKALAKFYKKSLFLQLKDVSMLVLANDVQLKQALLALVQKCLAVSRQEELLIRTELQEEIKIIINSKIEEKELFFCSELLEKYKGKIEMKEEIILILPCHGRSA